MRIICFHCVWNERQKTSSVSTGLGGSSRKRRQEGVQGPHLGQVELLSNISAASPLGWHLARDCPSPGALLDSNQHFCLQIKSSRQEHPGDPLALTSPPAPTPSKWHQKRGAAPGKALSCRETWQGSS